VTSAKIAAEAGANLDPIVVLAADDNFAMPLAATVRSALENLSPERTLQLYVLDGGLSDATKERLIRSWPAGRFQIAWVDVDPSVLALAPISGHANRVNYYRILTPWLLPTDIQRIIYLDADLIVHADLSLLWQSDMQDQLCMAVQDCAAPYFDSQAAPANFERCGPYLGSATPVANFRALGLDPQAAYFNSGVLLIDLAAWRDADIPRQMLDCLEKNREHVRWWDQYALNVVLAGQWAPLDLRWNQGSHVYVYPNSSCSPFDHETYEGLRDNPYIVHFTTRYKPWRASCLHPRRKEFYHYLDRTDWAGWRSWHAHPFKTFLELMHAQERRFRRSRRNLQKRFAA
jgi:lipopolysaccharide biosynthesis glycosyltransferase